MNDMNAQDRTSTIDSDTSEYSDAQNGSNGEDWYWASATFKAVHVGSRRKRHLWERIVFLIQVPDANLATHIAERVARKKEHEYEAAGGDMVRWVLQEIERVEPVLDVEIQQGTEVYSEFFERVDKPEKTRRLKVEASRRG